LTGEQAVKIHASSFLALWTKREIKLILNWKRIPVRIKEKIAMSFQEPFFEKNVSTFQGICPFPRKTNKPKVRAVEIIQVRKSFLK